MYMIMLAECFLHGSEELAGHSSQSNGRHMYDNRCDLESDIQNPRRVCMDPETPPGSQHTEEILYVILWLQSAIPWQSNLGPT